MKKGGFILIFLTCISIFSQEEKLSFSTVEEVPIYKGCENFKTSVIRKQCMLELLNEHIQKEFNYAIANCLEQKTMYNRKKGTQKKCIPVLLSGEKRMFLNFIIDKDGTIKNISSRAPHIKLKEEAVRVGKLIPNMLSPAKHHGKEVEISFSLPIDFTVK